MPPKTASNISAPSILSVYATREMMQVHEAMSRHCMTIGINETVRSAAQLMANEEVGCLPVDDDGQIVGMLTDRDIVTRCLALTNGEDSLVRDSMSVNVKLCFDDDELGDVLRAMASSQLRRLPVLDRNHRLVGILSLSDAARNASPGTVGAVFCSVTAQSMDGGHKPHLLVK